MMKKIFGIICIFHPLVFSIILNEFGFEYSWYFTEHYKLYDLIYSITSFLIFSTGILLLLNHYKITVVIFCSTVFIVYQVLGWNFDTHRYLSSLSISNELDLLLVPNDGGAFTVSNSVNLEVSEKKFLIFIKNSLVKSYDDIYSGNLLLKNEQEVNIELTTFSKQKVFEVISINELTNKLN